MDYSVVLIDIVRGDKKDIVGRLREKIEQVFGVKLEEVFDVGQVSGSADWQPIDKRAERKGATKGHTDFGVRKYLRSTAKFSVMSDEKRKIFFDCLRGFLKSLQKDEDVNISVMFHPYTQFGPIPLTENGFVVPVKPNIRSSSELERLVQFVFEINRHYWPEEFKTELPTKVEKLETNVKRGGIEEELL